MSTPSLLAVQAKFVSGVLILVVGGRKARWFGQHKFFLQAFAAGEMESTPFHCLPFDRVSLRHFFHRTGPRPQSLDGRKSLLVEMARGRHPKSDLSAGSRSSNAGKKASMPDLGPLGVEVEDAHSASEGSAG